MRIESRMKTSFQNSTAQTSMNQDESGQSPQLRLCPSVHPQPFGPHSASRETEFLSWKTFTTPAGTPQILTSILFGLSAIMLLALPEVAITLTPQTRAQDNKLGVADNQVSWTLFPQSARISGEEQGATYCLRAGKRQQRSGLCGTCILGARSSPGVSKATTLMRAPIGEVLWEVCPAAVVLISGRGLVKQLAICASGWGMMRLRWLAKRYWRIWENCRREKIVEEVLLNLELFCR